MNTIERSTEMKQEIIEEIFQALKKINYGEVVITIHNSKIVQIENKEKKRFNQI